MDDTLPAWFRDQEWTAVRPRRGEPGRVPARHLLRPRHPRRRLAAAVLVAGSGLVVIAGSAWPTGRAADAAHDRQTPPSAWASVLSTGTVLPSSAAARPAVATPTRTPGPSVTAAAAGLAADGIPQTALQAYQQAADLERTRDAACVLTWPLLAAIGRIESDHGRYGGAVLLTDGAETKAIIGPALDGAGVARIPDSDHGRLDGDTTFDRAVGPMQFIPSTWSRFGLDGNRDGVADPENIFDAADTAAAYLCAAGGELASLAGQTRAILAYNQSTDYLAAVLGVEQTYAAGVSGLVVPALPAGSRAPTPTAGAVVPPANPGTALGVAAPATSGSPATPSHGPPATGTGPPTPPASSSSSGPAPTSASDSPAPSGALSPPGPGPASGSVPVSSAPQTPQTSGSPGGAAGTPSGVHS